MENLSILENSAITWPYTDHPNFRPSAPQAYQCLISHFLASLGGCNLILYIHVLIDWQLSKQCFCWPVSPDRIAGSGFDPLSSSNILKVFADKLLLFKWSQAQVQFFKNAYEISRVSWAALLKCWFRTDLGHENSTGFYIYMQGRQSLFTFLTVTRWSRSTSSFYVLIGQNLTGEFMRKIFAASGNLLTDSWSWESFVSSCDVLNCLFLLGVQNEIQLLSRLFCNSWLVCSLRFLLTNAPLVKVIGNPISDGIVFKNQLTHCTCPCLRRKKVEKSQAILEHLMTFRSSTSTGKPEQLLSLMCFFFSVSWSRAYGLCGLSLYTSNDLTYNSIRFKKPLDIFWPQIQRKGSLNLNFIFI